MAHSEKTGGLMELGDIKQKLIKSRGRSAKNQVVGFFFIWPTLTIVEIKIFSSRAYPRAH